MQELFIDTDVIIDLLADRKPFSEEATTLFTLAEQKKIRICTSSLTFSNLYYILRKFETHQRAISKLIILSGIMTVLNVDEVIVKKAIHSEFNDFEDGLQYYCALNYKHTNAIITRNIKDYRNSELPVMTPCDYLNTIR